MDQIMGPYKGKTLEIHYGHFSKANNKGKSLELHYGQFSKANNNGITSKIDYGDFSKENSKGIYFHHYFYRMKGETKKSRPSFFSTAELVYCSNLVLFTTTPGVAIILSNLHFSHFQNIFF